METKRARLTPGAKAPFLFAGDERPEPEGSGYLEAKTNTGVSPLRSSLREELRSR
jgi:hypothetical protein